MAAEGKGEVESTELTRAEKKDAGMSGEKEGAIGRRGQKITDEGAYYRSAEFTTDAVSFPFYRPGSLLLQPLLLRPLLSSPVPLRARLARIIRKLLT